MLPVITTLTFLAASSLLLLVMMLVARLSMGRAGERMEEMAEARAARAPGVVHRLTHVTLPKLAKPLMPGEESERTVLRTRLTHAGFYSRNAIPVFLGIKMVLIVTPIILGLAAGLFGLVTLLHGFIGGALGSVLGIFGPDLWLAQRKRSRQITLRRSLPDALDIVVLCMDGGLSLQGAVQRVAGELSHVYRLLSSEFTILLREIQLGRSPGEAMQSFAQRTDLEEVRSLAGVVMQSEKFGASIAKAMRLHAEMLRFKRMQRAEELAYTAATKMIFPTVLFIFPAMLYVTAGPAVYQVLELFRSLQK